jgi:LacI family transcriptional regulator
MNGYPSTLQGGLARRRAERGHDLLLIQSRDERIWRERLAERRVDGAVVIDRAPPGLLDDPGRLPVPVVLMNLEAPAALPQVLLDDMAIAGCAARHLLELGHRHIGYCRSDGEHASDLLRQAGCQAAVAAGGRGRRLSVIHGLAQAAEVLDRDDRPTAIVAYADMLAARILHLALARGLRIPGDLSVVGINDDPMDEHTTPPLTSVALPHDPFGFAAADLLLDLIEGRTPAETRILLPGHLVVRGSTGLPG